MQDRILLPREDLTPNVRSKNMTFGKCAPGRFPKRSQAPPFAAEEICQTGLEPDSQCSLCESTLVSMFQREFWCERGDSNPHGFPRRILSPVRLPTPPLS